MGPMGQEIYKTSKNTHVFRWNLQNFKNIDNDDAKNNVLARPLKQIADIPHNISWKYREIYFNKWTVEMIHLVHE